MIMSTQRSSHNFHLIPTIFLKDCTNQYQPRNRPFSEEVMNITKKFRPFTLHNMVIFVSKFGCLGLTGV